MGERREGKGKITEGVINQESVIGKQKTEYRKPNAESRILNSGRNLFLTEEDTDGYTGKIKMLTQFILQVVAVGFLDVIREIAEKCK